jgi:hypothetical protein
MPPITRRKKMADLRELIARKKAEKEAAAEAAVVAAEAEKTANAKASAEVAAKITAAKDLVLELLSLGEPDEETLTTLEAQYAELPGLREAVGRELRQQKADAEQKTRWARVAACEKRIENLPTDQLPYDLASEMVELGALEEITPERKDTIFAYNKGVREAGNSSRQTFVRQSFDKAEKKIHFYLDRKRWASDALNKHHRAVEQSRKMLARHDIKPTFSEKSGVPQVPVMGAALAKAQGAGQSPARIMGQELDWKRDFRGDTPPVVKEALKPPRQARRAAKRLAEVGEGGPAKTDSRPAEKSRGGAGSDEGSRAMRGELPEA